MGVLKIGLVIEPYCLGSTLGPLILGNSHSEFESFDRLPVRMFWEVATSELWSKLVYEGYWPFMQDVACNPSVIPLQGVLTLAHL